MFFDPTEIFSLIYEDVTIASENLCAAFMTIEQWDLFNVPRLLWHVFKFLRSLNQVLMTWDVRLGTLTIF